MINDLMDRYRAVLLGCARGDALGMPVEGWKREQIKKYAPNGKITDFIDPIIVRNEKGWRVRRDEYGKLKCWTRDFKAGEWTDDTILTMAIAESIASSGKMDLKDIAKRQLREYQIRKLPGGKVFGGFGGTTRIAFKRQEHGVSFYNSGVIGGPGNGPAMKMHPLGMWMHATGDVSFGLECAKIIGKMTHLDPRSITSGEVQAVAIYSLLNDCSREEFLETIRETSRTHEKPLDERFTWHKSGSLLKRIEWIYDNRDKSPDEAFSVLGASSAVYQSHPFALFMFQRFWESPLEGLIETVNFGGDCDTTGAIYGALAGARNGTKIFPESWKKGWSDIDRLYNVADGIYNIRDDRKEK